MVHEPRIEFTAYVEIDGEIKGKVRAYDLNGLDAQLYKLGKVEERFIDGDFDE